MTSATTGWVVLFGLLLALGLLLVVRLWAKMQADSLKRAWKHRDHYFEAAESIVSDPRTPDEVIRLILTVAEGIPLRRVRVRFVKHLLLRRLGVETPTTPQVEQAFHVADSMPDDLRRKFARSGLELMASVTYQSAILGPWIRREMKRVVRRENNPPSDCDRRDGVAQKLVFTDAAGSRLRAA